MINVKMTDRDMERIGTWNDEKKKDASYIEPSFKLPFQEFELHFTSQTENSYFIYRVKKNKGTISIETESVGFTGLKLLIKCKIEKNNLVVKKLYSGSKRKEEPLNNAKLEQLNKVLTPLILFIKYTISKDKELKIEKQLRLMKQLFVDKPVKKEKTFSSSGSKKEKNNNEIPVTTINKVSYSNHDKDLNAVKRHYTKPSHEVPTRGHYRHCRSGKIVWIKETVKYKDKDKIKDKTYKL